MSNLLLPRKYKLIGWCLLIPATILGLVSIFTEFDAFHIEAKTFAFFSGEFMGPSHSFEFIKTDLTQTIIGVVFIVGAMFVSFSKEKNEDEFIGKLRLSSLLWAILVNYSLLLLCFLFIYGTDFLSVMIWNMFTILIIFIVRFNYILYRSSQTVPDEK